MYHGLGCSAVLTLGKDGIYDALKQAYLASVQLSVIPDKTKRQNVIEAYTFTFEYGSRSSTDQLQFNGIVIAGTQGRKVTIRNARKGLDHLMRNLVVLTESLPYLPGRGIALTVQDQQLTLIDKRYLDVHLFYTDDRPEGYRPQGFKPSNAINMHVPETESWKLVETRIGSMDSGCHRSAGKC